MDCRPQACKGKVQHWRCTLQNWGFVPAEALGWPQESIWRAEPKIDRAARWEGAEVRGHGWALVLFWKGLGPEFPSLNEQIVL
jgi:hypothetical protein